MHTIKLTNEEADYIDDIIHLVWTLKTSKSKFMKINKNVQRIG